METLSLGTGPTGAGAGPGVHCTDDAGPQACADVLLALGLHLSVVPAELQPMNMELGQRREV